MKNSIQIKIHDYKFCGFSEPWAYVTIFDQDLNLQFTKYDAITAAMELGFMEEPTDRDEKRVGYEKTAFSATAREVWPWEQRVNYQENDAYLFEFGGSIQGEQIITRLAWQNEDVKEIIQAEATAICCCDCPPEKTNELQLKIWWAANYDIPLDCINWEHVSQHKKLSLRTENKLVEKLL